MFSFTSLLASAFLGLASAQSDFSDIERLNRGLPDTPVYFYWSGYKEMKLPAQPIWIETYKDSCHFSIGIKDSDDPKATGTCDNKEMTFSDGNTAQMYETDDFGWGGWEPDASRKYADASRNLFMWVVKHPNIVRDPTPFMFYWEGFEAVHMPPVPIWFAHDEDADVCTFAISDQLTEDPKLIGTCNIDDFEMPTLTFMNDDTVQFYMVDSFDAGDHEPPAITKWTDKDSMYIWEVDDMLYHEHAAVSL